MIILLVLVLLITTPSWAAEYYVAKSGNGGSDSNNCTAAQSISTPKLTIASALANCVAAGDTLYIRAGTYAEGMRNTIPIGSSTSARTIVTGYADEVAAIRPTSGQYVINLEGRGYITIQKLVLDGGGGATGHVIRINGDAATDVVVQDNEITGAVNGSGVIVGGTAHRYTIQRNWIHANGSSHFDHGGYLQSDFGIFTRNLVELNSGRGVQWYRGGQPAPNNATVTHNIFRNNCAHATAAGKVEVTLGGRGHIFSNNIVSTTTGTCAVSVQVAYGTAGPGDDLIMHNALYNTKSGTTKGIQLASANNVSIQNNIILGYTTSVSSEGSTAGTTLTTNLTTGIATDIWTSPSTGDFSLKSGSAAINAGTAIGVASCGSAPDQGALETLVVTAASVNGDLMDVTICNAAPPIIPGTFTVARSGGTPTVLSTSLLGGSGGIVRLEVSETCAAAQTWTVSAGTTTTDSALIGGSLNQPLHTVTNFPVDSSLCDGTGPPALPGSPLALYEFDGNANDSSGNANHATTSNITYTTGKYDQGALTVDGVDSYVDTILSGHNPSTTHLVVAMGVWVAPTALGGTKDIWGVPTGTNQRFLLYRHGSNIWRMSIQGTSGTDTEFPVVSGWTHLCVKANATTDVATLYVNGVAGTLSGASTIPYTSYTFAGDLRFGLPSGFGTTLSGNHIFDRAVIYNTDVSCANIYAAWEPPTVVATATQVAHRWNGVYLTSSGAVENRGAVNEQRTVVDGGSVALMVQVNNETGSTLSLQPRFRYNINGGDFTNVVPDLPTADGVSYLGTSILEGLNNGIADGPISGALTHTDGITLTTSSSVPTLSMADDTSYTLRGIFTINATVGDVVCFKIYDQGGSALASYTPSAGACVTVIAPQGNKAR